MNVFNNSWGAPKGPLGPVPLVNRGALPVAPQAAQRSTSPSPAPHAPNGPIPIGDKGSCPVCRTFGGR